MHIAAESRHINLCTFTYKSAKCIIYGFNLAAAIQSGTEFDVVTASQCLFFVYNNPDPVVAVYFKTYFEFGFSFISFVCAYVRICVRVHIYRCVCACVCVCICVRTCVFVCERVSE